MLTNNERLLVYIDDTLIQLIPSRENLTFGPVVQANLANQGFKVRCCLI